MSGGSPSDRSSRSIESWCGEAARAPGSSGPSSTSDSDVPCGSAAAASAFAHTRRPHAQRGARAGQQGLRDPLGAGDAGAARQAIAALGDSILLLADDGEFGSEQRELTLAIACCLTTVLRVSAAAASIAASTTSRPAACASHDTSTGAPDTRSRPVAPASRCAVGTRLTRALDSALRVCQERGVASEVRAPHTTRCRTPSPWPSYFWSGMHSFLPAVRLLSCSAPNTNAWLSVAEWPALAAPSSLSRRCPFPAPVPPALVVRLRPARLCRGSASAFNHKRFRTRPKIRLVRSRTKTKPLRSRTKRKSLRSRAETKHTPTRCPPPPRVTGEPRVLGGRIGAVDGRCESGDGRCERGDGKCEGGRGCTHHECGRHSCPPLRYWHTRRDATASMARPSPCIRRCVCSGNGNLAKRKPAGAPGRIGGRRAVFAVGGHPRGGAGRSGAPVGGGGRRGAGGATAAARGPQQGGRVGAFRRLAPRANRAVRHLDALGAVPFTGQWWRRGVVARMGL